jgi:hypothetical protein
MIELLISASWLIPKFVAIAGCCGGGCSWGGGICLFFACKFSVDTLVLVVVVVLVGPLITLRFGSTVSSASSDTRLLVVLNFDVDLLLELPGPSDSSDSELSASTEEARGRSSVSSDSDPNSRVLFCFLTADFLGSTVLVFALPPRGGLGISEVGFSVSVFAVLLLVVSGFSFTFELERDSERPESVVVAKLEFP